MILKDGDKCPTCAKGTMMYNGNLHKNEPEQQFRTTESRLTLKCDKCGMNYSELGLHEYTSVKDTIETK